MLLLEKLSCRPKLINSLSNKLRMRYISCGHGYVIVLSENGKTNYISRWYS